ncbi:MAG: hypothetical protein CMP10_01805 [Zetaproteobacteria bacterium]|nr:hypothetical protein [Pseudobdellovibrionaceae bacterium]
MYLEISRHNSMVRWRINRPERFNALGVTMGHLLSEALTELEEKIKARPDEYRALVIEAAPQQKKGQQRIWIAGGDMKELAQLDFKEGEAYSRQWHSICVGLQELPIPVVVLIDGLAIGGGAELALSADIRIGNETTGLWFLQMDVGLATGYGGATRLTALVGTSLASYWLLSGKKLSATEAKEAGLLHELYRDSGDMELWIHNFEKRIDKLGYESVAAQKAMLAGAVHYSTEKARKKELKLFAKLWGNKWHKQALEKYLDSSH